MAKASLFVRFLIVAGIFLLYILCLVEWQVFDGLLKSFPIGAYLITIVLGALSAGIAKGRLPGKKVVEYSKDNFKEQEQSIIGYWIWILIGVVFFTIWLPIYKGEM